MYLNNLFARVKLFTYITKLCYFHKNERDSMGFFFSFVDCDDKGIWEKSYKDMEGGSLKGSGPSTPLFIDKQKSYSLIYYHI